MVRVRDQVGERIKQFAIQVNKTEIQPGLPGCISKEDAEFNFQGSFEKPRVIDTTSPPYNFSINPAHIL